MTIGCIFTSWQAADLLNASLTPWVEARRKRLGGNDFRICAVSIPFVGFPQDEPPDATVPVLQGCLAFGQIDHLITQREPMKETEARGAALRWLVKQGAELTVMVDSDEFWTAEQIVATLTFVEANPWIAWFRVCYKQLTFTRGQWLKEPFTPPRIHRTHVTPGYVAEAFWDDNNVQYGRTREPMATRDTQMSSMTVPQGLVWVKHETWTNSPRSKAKVAYQNARPGWLCDFAWDDTRGGLVWRDGLVPPEVTHD